jgi:CelD/BcsL family acetyltransferase involved in cellulose biosynthesis
VRSPGKAPRLAARAARRSLVIEARSGWEEYLGPRSKHLRSKWRRKKRRLDASGRVTVIGVSSPEELERFLPCVERVEARSWKDGSGSSLAADPACRRFYFELARRAARRGWLRLHLLLLDGQPAAYVLGIAYANELLALKTSYDGFLARFSPGQALMLAVLEASAREGLQAVDLLGFPARWKTEMANGERAHVDLCLFRRGSIDCVSCAFIQRRVKPFARARLPGIASLANRGLGFLHHRH